MNVLAQTIDGIQEVLAICPCCGEIFRLVEGKFVFPKQRPKTCEYLDLVALEGRIAEEEAHLSSAEERFADKLQEQRQGLVELGRRQAKKRLRIIDPIFSAKDIDPQDVKVVFDPVEYLIFHGLNSEHGLDFVEFVSRVPISKLQEAMVKSIDQSVRAGRVGFETLHMRDDGSFDVRKG
jgi:predicted Holliday junction resolvase-like endonuclease